MIEYQIISNQCRGDLVKSMNDLARDGWAVITMCCDFHAWYVVMQRECKE